MKEENKKKKEAIIEEINKRIGFLNTEMRFVLEGEKVILEVFNKETKEVFKRIPPKEVMKSFNKISELVGSLIEK